MKVSQAAIDEVRAVRLAQEDMQRREKLARLTRMVDCCATCRYREDQLGYMQCDKHEMDTRSYLICNDHERRTR